MSLRKILLIVLMQIGTASFAQNQLYLWQGAAPYALGDNEADKPCVFAYFPDSAVSTGSAVIVCPGGGYRFLAMDHEGAEVANWLNKLGITAFVLRYRINSDERHYMSPVPFMDAQRALKVIRHNARDWKINPEKIGIMGFSAGGHLAAMTGTHFDSFNKIRVDTIEKESSHPNFLILAYPVITLTQEFGHIGSREALAGSYVNDGIINDLSVEKQVTGLTPPTFLIHTTNDKIVPVENSILFYQSLRNWNIPAEIHLYEDGPHGFGLAEGSPVLSSWTGRLKDWLKNQGCVR